MTNDFCRFLGFVYLCFVLSRYFGYLSYLINIINNYIVLVKKKFIVVSCPSLTLKNGEVEYLTSPENEQHVVDTVASFTCHNKYHISGSNSITCQNAGNWSQETPRCIEGNKYVFIQLMSFISV